MPRPRSAESALAGTGREHPETATFSPATVAGESAPESLSEEGRRLWARLTHLLGDELDEADLPALEVLCRAWGIYRRAAAEFEAAPVTPGSRNNLVMSPWYGVMNTEGERLRKLFNAFKLTPEARAKLGQNKKTASLDTDLAAVLGIV